MDKMVAVGTAVIIGLVLAGLLVLGGIIRVFDLAMTAWTTHDWSAIISFVPAVILIASGYLVIGLWLRKAGYT